MKTYYRDVEFDNSYLFDINTDLFPTINPASVLLFPENEAPIDYLRNEVKQDNGVVKAKLKLHSIIDSTVDGSTYRCISVDNGNDEKRVTVNLTLSRMETLQQYLKPMLEFMVKYKMYPSKVWDVELVLATHGTHTSLPVDFFRSMVTVKARFDSNCQPGRHKDTLFSWRHLQVKPHNSNIEPKIVYEAIDDLWSGTQSTTGEKK